MVEIAPILCPIQCTLDLCVAYDDGPSHVSRRLSAYIPSFGLFIRQRLAMLLSGLVLADGRME